MVGNLLIRPGFVQIENRNWSEADSDLTCQSGARWEDINETLKEKGIPLFFPVRVAFCSIWMIHPFLLTAGSGTRCCKPFSG
jgi:hypothetical protein